jgi:hypothetical protein
LYRYVVHDDIAATNNQRVLSVLSTTLCWYCNRLLARVSDAASAGKGATDPMPRHEWTRQMPHDHGRKRHHQATGISDLQLAHNRTAYVWCCWSSSSDRRAVIGMTERQGARTTLQRVNVGELCSEQPAMQVVSCARLSIRIDAP